MFYRIVAKEDVACGFFSQGPVVEAERRAREEDAYHRFVVALTGEDN